MNGIRIVKHNSFQRFHTMERNMHPILAKRKKTTTTLKIFGSYINKKNNLFLKCHY